MKLPELAAWCLRTGAQPNAISFQNATYVHALRPSRPGCVKFKGPTHRADAERALLSLRDQVACLALATNAPERASR